MWHYTTPFCGNLSYENIRKLALRRFQTLGVSGLLYVLGISQEPRPRRGFLCNRKGITKDYMKILLSSHRHIRTLPPLLSPNIVLMLQINFHLARQMARNFRRSSRLNSSMNARSRDSNNISIQELQANNALSVTVRGSK